MDGARDGEDDVSTNNKSFLIRSIIISLAAAAALTGTQIAAAQSADAYLGGTRAIGRVAQVYVRGGDNVFLALKQAPQHLRNSAERWIEVEFADFRSNGIAPAHAVLNQSQAAVEAGDVVEVQFAHRENPRYFPLKEATRVTTFVETGNEALARNHERRAPALEAPDALPAFWQQQPRAHTASSSLAPAATATAGIAH